MALPKIGKKKVMKSMKEQKENCHVHNIFTINHTWLVIISSKKFVILFDLNKLLDFVKTKLLGKLIESNEIPSPWVFFLPSLSPTKFRLYS